MTLGNTGQDQDNWTAKCKSEFAGFPVDMPVFVKMTKPYYL